MQCAVHPVAARPHNSSPYARLCKCAHCRSSFIEHALGCYFGAPCKCKASAPVQGNGSLADICLLVTHSQTTNCVPMEDARSKTCYTGLHSIHGAASLSCTLPKAMSNGMRVLVGDEGVLLAEAAHGQKIALNAASLSHYVSGHVQ